MKKTLAMVLACIMFLCNVPVLGDEPVKSEWDKTRDRTDRGVIATTYYSELMGCDIGYYVWLPPGWQEDGAETYPAMYYLHFLAGDSNAGVDFIDNYRGKIERGEVPPAIYVSVEGCNDSYYMDSMDDTKLLESSILTELFPDVEKKYRAIPDGKSRSLLGFSMGGSGCFQLSFAYPEAFAAMASMAGDLHDNGSADIPGGGGRPHLLNDFYYGDREAYEEESPFGRLKENHERIKDPETGVKIRQYVGRNDFTYGSNQQMDKWLTYFGVEHDFIVDDKDHGGDYQGNYGGDITSFLCGNMVYSDGLRGYEKGVVLPADVKPNTTLPKTVLNPALDESRNLTPSATVSVSDAEFPIGSITENHDGVRWMYSRQNPAPHFIELNFNKSVKIDAYQLLTGFDIGAPAVSYKVCYFKNLEWVEIPNASSYDSFNVWTEVRNDFEPVVTSKVRLYTDSRTAVRRFNVYGEAYVEESGGNGGDDSYDYYDPKNNIALGMVPAVEKGKTNIEPVNLAFLTDGDNTDGSVFVDGLWEYWENWAYDSNGNCTQKFEFDFGNKKAITSLRIFSGTQSNPAVNNIIVEKWDESRRDWNTADPVYTAELNTNTEKEWRIKLPATMYTSKIRLQIKYPAHSGSLGDSTLRIREIELFAKDEQDPKDQYFLPENNVALPSRGTVITSNRSQSEVGLLNDGNVSDENYWQYTKEGEWIDTSAQITVTFDGVKNIGSAAILSGLADYKAAEKIVITAFTENQPEGVEVFKTSGNNPEKNLQIKFESVIPATKFNISLTNKLTGYTDDLRVREIQFFETTEDPSGGGEKKENILYHTSHNDTEAQIIWKPIENAGGYDIYRDGVKIGTVENGNLYYLDTGLSRNTEYRYKIAPKDTQEFSNEAVVKTSGAYAPTRLTSREVKSRLVELQWDLPVKDTAGYKVLRREQVENFVIQDAYNVYRNGQLLATIQGNRQDSYIDRAVEPFTEYAYTIRGVKDGEESSDSNEVRIKTASVEEENNIALYKDAYTAGAVDTAGPTAVAKAVDNNPDTNFTPSNPWGWNDVVVDLYSERMIDKIVVEANAGDFLGNAESFWLYKISTATNKTGKTALKREDIVVPDGIDRSGDTFTITFDQPVVARKIGIGRSGADGKGSIHVKEFHIYENTDMASYELGEFVLPESLTVGKNEVSIDITNRTEAGGVSGELILAVYNKEDGMLVSAATEGRQMVAMGSTKTLKASVTLDDPSAYVLKAFLWESLENIQPLKESREVGR